ncbi:MAG: GTP pyrophosphokinase family protein [Treponema phagedenis]|uniref:GTP pyrophosphokinase n=1 Tax=Treponema phagedenis TaxID=162 RepID=UPI003133F886
MEAARPFVQLMMQYKCAMLEIQTKLEILNKELSLDSETNPFESITCRLKKPISIINKLKKLQLEPSTDNIEKNLHDVAGIRVVCTFRKDIYLLAEKLCSQDDIRLVTWKDYIKNPKPNGYRSLHLILEVPVFFAEGKKFMQVEVQFRTIAMDFWASIEHKIYYKKEIDCNTAPIVEKLRACAEDIHKLDIEMQEISEDIELYNCGAQEAGMPPSRYRNE